jgi:O-antigen ligase
MSSVSQSQFRFNAVGNALPRRSEAQTPAASALEPAWILFLLLNGALFLRPNEILPQLEGKELHIFLVLILLCLAHCLPAVFRQLRPSSLAQNPIAVCVIAILPAVIISLLANGDTWYVREEGIKLAQIVVYFLLLLALVNSPQRIRQLLLAVAIFALLLNIIALLAYHGIIDWSTVKPLKEIQPQVDGRSGENIIAFRLQAAGIYGNPNDLARIIAVGITICLYALGGRGSSLSRGIWLIPLAIFIYAMQLTNSRGGLLGLVAGIVILFHARFGLKKGGFAILFLLPILMVFAGRQTDIDTSSGTGQLRIKLWSNGLMEMRAHPIFGLGANTYYRRFGNHAHNSFIEAYVELGMLGGTFYAAAFYLATRGLARLKAPELEAKDPELWRMRPYLLSIIVGTIVAQLSSSREYSEPTYVILGLAAAFLALAGKHTPASIVRVSPRLAFRLLIVSVCTLVALHFYTKFNAHFG